MTDLMTWTYDVHTPGGRGLLFASDGDWLTVVYADHRTQAWPRGDVTFIRRREPLVFTETQQHALDVILCGGDTLDVMEELGVSKYRARSIITRVKRLLGVRTQAEIPPRAVALGLPGGDCADEEV